MKRQGGPGRFGRPARPGGRDRPGSGRSAGPPRGVVIVHEDNDVIVVEKPPGLLTATLPGQPGLSLFGALKNRERSRRRTGRIYVIHRLDKEASGLLVFARSERAFTCLKEEFRSKRVHRLYSAVVEGEILREEDDSKAVDVPTGSRRRIQPPISGTIQSFIHEDESGEVRSVGLGDVARAGPRRARGGGARPIGRDPGPRLAVTHWRVTATGQGRSLLQVRLDSGRKNQIRVHMQEFGHPIVGDARYGATTDPIGRLALHATELGFTHPATGQTMRFSSPAPASFHRAVGRTAPNEAPSADLGTVVTSPAAETSWDHVATWYDQLIDGRRSDHFDQVIIPGTLRLLGPASGMKVLDVACGQGELCRRLATMGLEVTGIDAAPRLIEAARRRHDELPEGTVPGRYQVGDARELPAVLGDPFDAATCIMALMNINPLEPAVRGVAAALRPGGAFVAVILHPSFRAPGQTSWGWVKPEARRRDGAGGPRQYRRVDGYLSPGQFEIVMNPGAASRGDKPVTTWTFHRPLQAYVAALASEGLLIEAIEEWPSVRVSQPGPRAAEENRARREIPLFLAFRAIKADR